MKTRYIKALFSVIALALMSYTAMAQSGLTGAWNGVLTFAGGELTIVLHVDAS